MQQNCQIIFAAMRSTKETTLLLHYLLYTASSEKLQNANQVQRNL